MITSQPNRNVLALRRTTCSLFGVRIAGIVLGLLAIATSFQTVAFAQPQEKSKDSPQHQVMNQLLSEYRNMSVDELYEEHRDPRELIDGLSFDPTKARFFDSIKSKLKLTEEEIELFQKNGFVSIDHEQRYSFGSAYYQVYASHLPVFVTSDSVLHALHRSFDDLLAEIEYSVIVPQLHEILKRTHEALLDYEEVNEVQENLKDVDLFLTVARNLLARGYQDPVQAAAAAAAAQRASQNRERNLSASDVFRKPSQKGKGAAKNANPTELSAISRPASPPINVFSKFDQDEEVLAIIGLIKDEKIQIPPRDSTEIYGGSRAVDFSQFKPRGHYTKSTRLQAYFRCMMWLSRADCGWFVQPPDPTTTIVCDPIRELTNASLLTLSLKASGSYPQFEAMNRILSHFASQDDNLTAPALHSLLTKHGINNVSDLTDETRVAKVFDEIGDKELGGQMIRSQAIFVDNVSYTVPPPSLFQMFGQKFVLDSFVMSNVVYDSILFEDRKVKRYMPRGLDVMAALGNEEALQLLESDLRKYQYSANLHAASKFVDACSSDFWRRDLYNSWLDSIRQLDKDITHEENIPEIMKTGAWQRKQLQTQLGSWSELRHDMVLYAKQSYSGVPGCEYTDGYVEPYPEFYRTLREFAERLRGALLDANQAEQNLISKPTNDREKSIRAATTNRNSKRIAYVARTINILRELESISRAELRGDKLTSQQVGFLEQTIDRRGSLRHGSGSKPRYDGWYCDLFYERDDVRKWDPTVIDVHTFPNPLGTPVVLEVGVGDANLGVFAVNRGESSTAYVGPLYSYYEFTQPANDRLTDQKWARMISDHASMPSRPEWTRDFQAKAKKRSIDRVSIGRGNSGICLYQTRNNKSVVTKSFPETDAGIAALVDYAVDQKITDRLSVVLSSPGITSKCLADLERLPNLTFVSFYQLKHDDPAVKRFRSNRPDVELRPNNLELVQANISENVSGYQTFNAKPNGRVAPGEKFQIYIELKGLITHTSFMGRQSKSNVDVVARLLDGEKRMVQKFEASDLAKMSGELSLWNFRAPEFQLSDDIPDGNYRLEVQVTDTIHPAKPQVKTTLEMAVESGDSHEETHKKF